MTDDCTHPPTGSAPPLTWEGRPVDEDQLWNWVRQFAGIEIARNPVCPEHQPPFGMFAEMFLRRPPMMLVLGSRGSGKSFLSGLETHLTSRFTPDHATRVLGGSHAQSDQIYRALTRIARRDVLSGGGQPDVLEQLLKHEARYRNGSEVSILAASSTSVRGPHVPTLKLDEVDEIDPEIREAAMGMCMSREGSPASVLMTSTWHRLDGPMGQLVSQARQGAFPLFTFCVFEVLEPCPEERSGPHLEHCPACPLHAYCHGASDGGPPLAKRSRGHYSIDALVQKLRSTSRRTFESDYLCRGPRAEGAWFTAFHEEQHVSERAEYDPALPVHLAIDSGVVTGAVFFQVRSLVDDTGARDEVHVFADYLAEGRTAEANARALLRLAESVCQGRLTVISTDPAGGARNPVGPTVIAEYERSGLRPLRRWPIGSVADGLALLESFVQPALGPPALCIHPRCRPLIDALASYRRARRAGHWLDHPEDPQHPAEDLVDALRGGLRLLFPEGRVVRPPLRRLPASLVI